MQIIVLHIYYYYFFVFLMNTSSFQHTPLLIRANYSIKRWNILTHIQFFIFWLLSYNVLIIINNLSKIYYDKTNNLW